MTRYKSTTKVVGLLVTLFVLSGFANGQEQARPVPKTMSIPAEFVPKEATESLSRFMGIPGLRGVPVADIGGVRAIYLTKNPSPKMWRDPLLKGDLILGLDGAGLGKYPMTEWRKALGESQGPEGDYKIKITRWRKGTITTFDFSVPRPREEKPTPDLTKGDKIPNLRIHDWKNIGPTGVAGWVDYRRFGSGPSRQILVTEVDKGSPADGILAKDDVILGADGKGAAGAPATFSADARKCIADAIADAEARNPATLKLLRWRSGKTDVVTLKLETLGAYSDTAPYNCEKSRAILRQSVDAMVRDDKQEDYGWGILPLLASDDPTNPNNDRNQAKAKEWAHRVILPEGKQLGYSPTGGMDAWGHGFRLIILGEYCLKTRDEALLPTLRAYAEHYAKHQGWFGTTGHGYAAPAPDGSPHGPITAYGALGMSGMHGLLGLSLAQRAGIRSEEIDAAVQRAEIFFSSYAHKGTIPYGEHDYWLNTSGDNNGKCSGTALALQLNKVRPEESLYFAKVGTVSSHLREFSHAGPFFNAVWPPLASTTLGEKAANHYFKRSRWNYDLSRGWDHRVSPRGPSWGKYAGFSQEITTLLTYALPLRQLYVTGRGQDQSRWLSDGDLKEVVAVEDYDASKRDLAGLEKDLSSWAPWVRHAAAIEMAGRVEELDDLTAPLTAFHALVRDTNASDQTRAAACDMLGNLGDPSSAPVLVELLQDKKSFVRYWAAKALRQIDRDAVMPHIDAILRAAVANARPVFPMDTDDPLQLAHAEIGRVLFDSRDGVLRSSIEGVNRELLWPAVNALAQTPTGSGRSPIGNLYKQLGPEDVRILADTIVESVRFQSPADSMFSGLIRSSGIEALEKNSIAEGAHLAVDTPLHRAHEYAILQKFGPAALEWDPSGRILQILWFRLVMKESIVPLIQATLEALLADTKDARVLTSLKHIEAVTAANPELTLPASKTVLKVKATNYALHDEKETTYKWRKVYGASKVGFAPNASWDSKETTVTFTDAKPGKYRFEVTMSDILGYTVVQDTVDVTVLDTNGKLPANQPPVAQSQSITATPGIPVAIRLSGSDPEKADLGFAIKGKPAHGTLSGTLPNVSYTADWGYTGADAFTFDVLDGQGVSATGMIGVDVKPRKIGLTVYEGFDDLLDYEPGPLNGQSGNSGIGLQGAWKANTPNMKLVAGVKGYAALPAVGSSALTGWGRRGATATRSLDTAAMKKDGLLANGRELWFSMRVTLGPAYNGINHSCALRLIDGSGKTETSVGLAMRRGAKTFATINGTSGARHSGGRSGKLFPKDRSHLLMGRCQWGATDAEPDTVSIFRVIDLPRRGPTRVEEPVATHTGVADQARLDTLDIFINGAYLLDEIRIGPSYYSVLLGTVPMDKADPVQE